MSWGAFLSSAAGYLTAAIIDREMRAWWERRRLKKLWRLKQMAQGVDLNDE
jgi:hypothetical protein